VEICDGLSTDSAFGPLSGPYAMAFCPTAKYERIRHRTRNSGSTITVDYFRTQKMTETEKRKFIRYDALHLLDYNVVAKDGSKGIYSMGRTLDVSIDGIKMEIKDQLPPGTLLLVTVGLEENLIELLGEVTHTETKAGRYISGIAFQRMTKEGRKIFTQYAEAFRQRQEQLRKEGLAA
jgi:hypothetical protein